MSARPIGWWFMLAAGIAVAGALVAALLAIGSPTRQRAQRFDERRVADLQSLHSAIDDYMTSRTALPADLDALQRATPQMALDLDDPRTGARYGYRPLGARRYALCARFALPRLKTDRRGYGDDGWLHRAGRDCFEFVAPDPAARGQDLRPLSPPVR